MSDNTQFLLLVGALFTFSVIGLFIIRWLHAKAKPPAEPTPEALEAAMRLQAARDLVKHTAAIEEHLAGAALAQIRLTRIAAPAAKAQA